LHAPPALVIEILSHKVPRIFDVIEYPSSIFTLNMVSRSIGSWTRRTSSWNGILEMALL
jgi:hypothetical protein